MTLHRAMREMAEDYICLRRSLGFKFRDPNQGWLVRDFARNLDDQHVTRVTTQAAAAWATLPSTSLAWHSCRLSVARGFAGYLHALDPVHQVPPADLIPSRYHRPSPCLFSAAGIAALIQAAGTLRPALRAATLQTVIALLATTGIRPGEAVALNREHVDLHNAVLTVASTKFGKSREILLHSTAVAALADYGHLRDRLCPHPVDPGFFVPRPGGPRLNRRQLDYAFAYLAAQAGLRSRSSRCHPAPIGPAAYVRRQHAHQLVPGRRRRRRAPAAAVHLDGTRPARRYLLVPAGGPRTAGAGRRADDPRPPRPRGTTMGARQFCR